MIIDAFCNYEFSMDALLHNRFKFCVRRKCCYLSVQKFVSIIFCLINYIQTQEL